MVRNLNPQFRFREDVSVLQEGTQFTFVCEKPFQLQVDIDGFSNFLISLHKGIESQDIPESLSPYLDIFRTRGLLQSHSEPMAFDTQDKFTKFKKWLQHNYKDPLAVWESLRKIEVLIVGCGGTGAIVTQNLLGCGIKNFHLIDYDVVQPDNFNRQYPFKHSDLGRLKTEALKDYILERVPEASVKITQIKVEKAEDLTEFRSTDYIICCADKPVGLINQLLTEAALSLDVPVLFGAVGMNDGEAGPLLKNSEEKKHYLLEWNKLLEARSKCLWAPTIEASCGPINSKVSSEIAELFLKYWE
ncbi:MAG: ThiF family adenylyltransferase [Bdellovibrionales bacterium]|nr:ThiF family adenylyltransferase [Bdellovibrionales bacterium]